MLTWYWRLEHTILASYRYISVDIFPSHFIKNKLNTEPNTEDPIPLVSNTMCPIKFNGCGGCIQRSRMWLHSTYRKLNKTLKHNDDLKHIENARVQMSFLFFWRKIWETFIMNRSKCIHCWIKYDRLYLIRICKIWLVIFKL